LTTVRKISYTDSDGQPKPILLIYNPNSGKKKNLVPRIEARLKGEGIPYKLMPTQKYFDSFEFGRDADLT
jgi:diacylglycerol kinase family enzyme